MSAQTTLSGEITRTGVALHSGDEVAVRLGPGEPGTGIVFVIDGIRVPATQSSMYMNDRVCSPSPQTSTRWSPDRHASATFRQIAAGAFSRPPCQVPCGPYTL